MTQGGHVWGFVLQCGWGSLPRVTAPVRFAAFYPIVPVMILQHRAAREWEATMRERETPKVIILVCMVSESLPPPYRSIGCVCRCIPVRHGETLMGFHRYWAAV